MQSRANGKQTLWVLAIALVLIALCLGGLWVYIQNADAEIGMHEVAVADLPKEENTFITWEKYDNFPPLFETEDDSKWSSGFGLMSNEKERLNSLKAEYANGRRPDLAAPALPAETGFAILPLDPASFGGITEYYFLPEALLTDEQLLQLIAYGEKKGASFTADTLTVKNSTRGDNGYPVNRLFSAGEGERLLTLGRRLVEDGLAPGQPEEPVFTLPVSGIAYIPLIPEPTASTDTFAFFPFRELTDGELLWETYRTYDASYVWLNPEEEANISPSADKAWMRSLLEDVSLMPISAKHARSSYVRKEATGEIHLVGVFETALVNGKKTVYSITASYPDKQILTMMVTLDDQNRPGDDTSQTPGTGEDINDPKWAEAAKKAVERIDPTGIEKVKADFFMTADGGRIPCIQYIVNMKNGGCYALAIRLIDGGINYILYAPVGPDPLKWIMENSW